MRLNRKTLFAPVLLVAGMAVADTGEDVELVRYMASMQYFVHKTALAIDHENRKLAKFYAHELEEYIEKLEGVESYDDHPVGRLARSILVPAFNAFDEALDGGRWDKTSAAFDAMVQKCNGCHKATDHDYIRIHRSSFNPFMQSFEPVEGGQAEAPLPGPRGGLSPDRETIER